MSEGSNSHPLGEVVEEYARGKLTGVELEQFEEHMLVCVHCQDQVAEADEYIAAMKAAAGKLQKEKPIAIQAGHRKRWPDWFGWLPTPVWAGALAVAVLAVAVWLPHQQEAGYDSEVTLQAMRGHDDGASIVPVAKSFLLKADVAGIPVASTYRLEIASSGGAIVWQATVPRQESMLVAGVRKKLPAGRYWVRLSDGAGTLLREYGLESR